MAGQASLKNLPGCDKVILILKIKCLNGISNIPFQSLFNLRLIILTKVCLFLSIYLHE